MFKILILFVIGFVSISTASYSSSKPFAHLLQRRQAITFSSTPFTVPVVDLGYERYEGFRNSTSKLDIYKGIRFAAPPIGSRRWQAPQAPEVNRSNLISATDFAPQCLQQVLSTDGGPSLPIPPGLTSEDCLFLNVWSPFNASDLPRGYNLGNGQQDMSVFMNTNNNSFVSVVIQYRLGAFGFLSSDEVFRNGVTNAGVLDQYFALQWVQAYIEQFGGDPNRVTIGGVSGGAGGVMLLGMMYGGTLGDSLFINTIAASPYLPMQYGYKDWFPSQSYYAFAIAAGCPPTRAYGNGSTIFECLVGKESSTLQKASQQVSGSEKYGTWAFLPVTDGVFIQQTPSQQLLQKKVNGVNMLAGVQNSADEGPGFTIQNIETEDDLVAWLRLTFPQFSESDISKILLYYLSTNASDTGDAALFATPGDTGPTAINQSDVATGQQQRANSIYGDITFACPSYWLAEAYTDSDHTSYKYQYSVPVALHSLDVDAFLGPDPLPNQGPELVNAMMHIWGDFITTSSPTLSPSTFSNFSSGDIAATRWPPFSIAEPHMLNLNQTSGREVTVPIMPPPMVDTYYYRENVGPGLQNDFKIVNAYEWEGGRGKRCDFWRSVGSKVPE
ncbi:carboxylesterase type B [Rhizodiscina lignyota]|uniref:Carboxylic ester hydrolase n=1 Tax=Rhizodiscina lignyota TaxID=1504668 RepID=A0A9P4M5C6_9PEZI|nr:carboxylesterase type B [Rhizodiscina lignyota]